MNSNILAIEITYNKKNIKIDLKEYIEKNSNFLKNELLNFCKILENKKLNNKKLYKLFEIEKNHNLWEMSLIKEKSNLKSENIYKSVIFLAIKKIISENKVKKIFFYNIPIEEKIIRSFFKNKNKNKKIIIKFINKEIEKKSIKSLIGKFFLFRFIYSFFNLIFRLFLELKKNKFVDKESNFIIFSYFAHFNNKNNKTIFNQFGKLTNILEKKFKLDNQYIFVPNKNNLTINSLQTQHSILNANLNLKNKLIIIKNFFIYSLKFFFIKKLILLNLKEYELSLFHIFSKDYDLSFNGSSLAENLIWIEVFENYLSKTSKKKLVYFCLKIRDGRRR